MNKKYIGDQTLVFENCPNIVSYGAVVGQKEGEGPLGSWFDYIAEEAMWGEETWEKAESKFVRETVQTALTKSGLNWGDINCIFAGDLMNQCTSSSYGVRDLNRPFVGLYGACSTMAESMMLSALFLDGGFGEYALAATSSHFCSAEKQFRFPLSYGGQRTPTAQWTVTGSGAAILSAKSDKPPYVTHATIGRINDYGITDINNMGAAMAPSFCDTLIKHLNDTGRQPDYYDMILSGDLGQVGKKIAKDLLKKENIDISSNFDDCGVLIFDPDTQDVHAGGSGCGCSGTVLNSYILEQMKKGKINNLLFIGTGALMSTTTFQQGDSIPGIAHAIAISNTK